MEKAVDNLESMFDKAEADLNFLSRKLEFHTENEQGVESQHNPVRLLKKVEEVKTEYAAIVGDVTAIQKAQKEAADFFRSQLLSLTQMLGKLEGETGLSPELTESTLNQFEELSDCLGIPHEDMLAVGGEGEVEESSSEEAILPPTKAAHQTETVVKQEAPEAPIEILPHEIRALSKEFLGLTQAEFMSVSNLIRGRAKLDDANKTYKTLWDHFKEEGNKEPLSPKEMNNKGMRVTGATGLAKLKILRSLKLCSIAKDGSVKLI